MNKLLTFTSVAVLCSVAAHANAVNYNIAGSFGASTMAAAYLAPGGDNLNTGGGFTIGGTVTTDTNMAGYSISGGSLTITGIMEIASFGVELELDLSGTASDAGVIWNAGTVCLSTSDASGSCGVAFLTVGGPGVNDPASFDWTSAATIFGIPASGLQLSGGAGGASFTIAQPGGVAPVLGGAETWGLGVGSVNLLGSDAPIFLDGNITFTQVAPQLPGNGTLAGSPNSIPTLPVYGLGLTILGLLLVAGRRLRKIKLRQ